VLRGVQIWVVEIHALISTTHNPYRNPRPSAFNMRGWGGLSRRFSSVGPTLLCHLLVKSDPPAPNLLQPTHPPLSRPLYRPLLPPTLLPTLFLHSLISLPITSPFSLCRLSSPTMCLPILLHVTSPFSLPPLAS